MVHDTVQVSLIFRAEIAARCYWQAQATPWDAALERWTHCAFRSLSHACAPAPPPLHIPSLPQTNIEVPLPLVVTGTLRGDVLEAFPCVLVAHERVGHAHRVSVADGAVAAQRYRGKQNRTNDETKPIEATKDKI